MGGHTKLPWCDYTFNPWWGCTRISPGCDHCYAAVWDRRIGGNHWDPHVPPRITSDAYWRGPLRWNRQLHPGGRRGRVFCGSMCDVADNRAPAGTHARLWQLIRDTPGLEWLLLTKRPQNIPALLPADWGAGYPNARWGITAENQEEAERRIPLVLQVPTRLAPLISAEPLLGPLRIGDYLHRLGWIILGGETGGHARPMDLAWAQDIVIQCRAAKVPVFMKQLGAAHGVRSDPKAANLLAWPEGLQVQEFP